MLYITWASIRWIAWTTRCFYSHWFWLFLLFEYIYLLQRQRDKYTNNKVLPTAGSLTKCLQRPELGQVEAKSPELHLHLPCGRQGPTHHSHHLPPRMTRSRSARTHYSKVGRGVPRHGHNVFPQSFLVRTLKVIFISKSSPEFCKWKVDSHRHPEMWLPGPAWWLSG